MSLLAPHCCLACSRTGSVVCRSCLLELSDARAPMCIGCARSAETGVCRECAGDWPVERAFVFSERAGLVKELIDEFKYSHKRAAYKELAVLACSLLPYAVDGALVPIPTIARHIRERGYDHAVLAGRRIARTKRLTYEPVLRRVTATVQHGASKRDRAAQASRAFTVRKRLDSEKLYIIYDDIVTTGASMKAAIGRLREAGARRIWVLAIARQPLDGTR